MRNFKEKKLNGFLFSLLCVVLVAAMTLIGAGCKDNSKGTPTTTTASDTTTVSGTLEAVDTTDDVTDAPETEEQGSNITVLGEGEKQFTFTVVDRDGNETAYVINTDADTVGEALLDLELIEGEDSAYGLYVKTVNGITADFEKDGVYWAFYIDGVYAMTGVDATEVVDGSSYAFKVE